MAGVPDCAPGYWGMCGTQNTHTGSNTGFGCAGRAEGKRVNGHNPHSYSYSYSLPYPDPILRCTKPGSNYYTNICADPDYRRSY